MGWIEINICVQRAMLLKVTKYSSPIRIASTITKQIPQRVDIRYFSYSSLANVSFYLSTASFLTSRSSIIIIQRHFYPDLARVLNARWGRSERKCLRKSVNLNPFKLKTWEKKNLIGWIQRSLDFIDEKLFSKQFLEVANTFARPFAHTRASSDSFVESRIATEISAEIETGWNDRSRKKKKEVNKNKK